MSMKGKFWFLFICLIFMGLSCSASEMTLKNIVPRQNEVRDKNGVVGDSTGLGTQEWSYTDPSIVWPDNCLFVGVNLNAGDREIKIPGYTGHINVGNMNVNDIWLRAYNNQGGELITTWVISGGLMTPVTTYSGTSAGGWVSTGPSVFYTFTAPDKQFICSGITSDVGQFDADCSVSVPTRLNDYFIVEASGTFTPAANRNQEVAIACASPWTAIPATWSTLTSNRRPPRGNPAPYSGSSTFAYPGSNSEQSFHCFGIFRTGTASTLVFQLKVFGDASSTLMLHKRFITVTRMNISTT
jgi:hypothetical protein